MADQSLIDRKLEVSRQLIAELKQSRAPMLAAYWEWNEEKGRWVFYVVPETPRDERKLVEEASRILIQDPYRSVFSLSDVVVDRHQIERAEAIARYIRIPRDLGRRFDTTFTGGHYFEGVIVVHVADELAGQHSAA